jgi:hypothetical protein
LALQPLWLRAHLQAQRSRMALLMVEMGATLAQVQKPAWRWAAIDTAASTEVKVDHRLAQTSPERCRA